MRSYVLDRTPDDLRKDLGTGATDVARIVSEIREKLHIEVVPSQNPDEERYWVHPTVQAIGHIFSMFPLTLDGLGGAVKRLVVNR